MSNDELKAKYAAFSDPGGPWHDRFAIHGVIHCNCRVDGQPGHPFTIGPEHVAEAADHHGGMLGEAVVNKIGCAHQDANHGPKCRRPYAAHTCDRVAVLRILRDLGNAEAAAALFATKAEIEADKLDGYVFLEGPHKIAPPDDS